MPRKQLIAFRKDTAAHWTSVDPILADGEPGYETNTGKVKLGDGINHWSVLPYITDAAAAAAAAAAEAALRGAYALIPRTSTKRAVGQDELVFNVKDYGAVGNGSTDDTAAIQAAVNAAIAGGTVLFPTGFYRVTSTITVTLPILLQGTTAGYDGSGKGSGISAMSGVSPFTCSSDRVAFRDLLFLANTTEAAATAAQTCAIKFTTGDSCSVERCRFTYFYIGVWFANCQLWTVADNQFTSQSGYHVLIQDVATPDGGDQNLRGNVFLSGATTWAGLAQVRQESGGGTRVIGNKFLGGPIGYQVAPSDGINTSILIVTGNSFELHTYAEIHFTSGTGGGTGLFHRIVINGNQFTGTLVSYGVLFCNAQPGQFSDVMFTNNVCAGTTGVTIFVDVANIDGLTVSENYFNVGLQAIYVRGTSDHVLIHPNNLTGITGNRYRFEANGTSPVSSPVLMEETKNFQTTSTTGDTYVATLAFSAVGSCLLEVTVIGNLTGTASGGIGGSFRRIVTLASVDANPVVTTVGTDTTGALPFVMSFLFAANNVFVTIKRDAADGGSSIQGSVTTRAFGAQSILG
jgi:hypothetical protein